MFGLGLHLLPYTIVHASSENYLDSSEHQLLVDAIFRNSHSKLGRGVSNVVR